MRQIILDTETTGLDHRLGHRIIEVAGVEVVNRRLTNRHFHHYVNPDRDIDEGAQAVHGISREFLADKPRFADIADSFLDFIDGAELVIHNAPFDVGFLNAELELLDDACDDAHGEVDEEQLPEELRQLQVADVPRPVPRGLEPRDEPDGAERDRHEEEVIDGRDCELPSREIEGIHRTLHFYLKDFRMERKELHGSILRLLITGIQ
mgnify:CR=1 FL=1